MSCDERVPAVRCCHACHEDHDYGLPMILEDGREVCCTTYHALEEAGIVK